MSSKRQQKKGYPLPENEFEEETTSYCITIPTGYEYFKAMESQLQALGLWWMWKRSEDRMTAASDTATTWRQLLTIEENCGDGDMATQEDIAKGMYQAINWLALQIATGQYSNIALSTDADGVVTIPSGDTTEPPVDDDPLTEVNEALSAQAGGAIGVRLGFNEIWTIVSSMFAAGDTVAEAQVRLTDQFLWEDPSFLTDFLNDYWAARTAAESFIAAFTTVLDGRLFCKGVTKLALSDWIYDTFTNESQKDMALYLKRAIAVEQMEAWFTYGAKTPSTAYVEYSCYRIQQETFSFDMSLANAPTYSTNGAWKQFHRMLVEIEGTFTDTDEPTILRDAMYKLDTVTGVKTFESTNFNAAGITTPTQSLVPYSANHKYSFTIDRPTGSGICIITKDNGSFALPNVAGTLTYKITDLGEYAI